MSSNDGRENSDGRRYPQNMQGLLQMSAANISSDADPSGNVQPPAMDAERRAWLNEVLNSVSQGDPVKLVLEDIKLLTDGDTDISMKELGLEELQHHCEDMDVANDFQKMGGLNLMKGFLQSSEEGLRWRAGEVVATVVQNNPFCQKGALEEDLLPLLLHLVDKDEHSLVRVKALYAVSCLTRDVPEAQEVFVTSNGFSVLIRAMQSDDDKLKLKSAFMLRALCISEPKFKDELYKLGMVEQLVSLLHTEHNDSHEHLMGALVYLVDGHQGNQEECRRPEMQLKEILQQKTSYLKGKEEYEEELAHVKQLYSMVFGSSANSKGEVDR